MIFNIRKAELNDYDSLLPLFDQIDLLHRQSLPQIFRKPEGKPREMDFYRDLLQQQEVAFYIAEDHGQIIGFLHAVVTNSPPLAFFAPRCYAVIESLVVKDGFQGMGAGRQLMEKAHAWAAECGAESVELNVYEFNAGAISFYKRLGYETLSRKMRRSLRNQNSGRTG